MTATAATMINSCAVMLLAPEGLGEVVVAMVGEVASTRSSVPYPFSMRVWNAGPNASCQAELFMANSCTYCAVTANGHSSTLLLQSGSLSEPSALGVMFRYKLWRTRRNIDKLHSTHPWIQIMLVITKLVLYPNSWRKKAIRCAPRTHHLFGLFHSQHGLVRDAGSP